MAIPAQGMTVTWGGTFLLEVREVNIDQDRGLPLQRDGTWTLQLGTVSVAGFSTANLALLESEYGKRKQLVFTGRVGTATGAAAVTLFSRDCILQDRRIAATVNGVLRFDHIFRIMDTVGAASNP
jgi:hypothetical protein